MSYLPAILWGDFRPRLKPLFDSYVDQPERDRQRYTASAGRRRWPW